MSPHPQPEALLRYRLQQVDFPPLQSSLTGDRRRAEVLFVLRRQTGLYMLMRKRSYPREAFRLPTGGVEPHESPHEAVFREAYEETGLRVKLHRYLGTLEYYPDTVAVDELEATKPLFTSHAYLIVEESGEFGLIDTSEGIDSWQKVDSDGLLAQADRLEGLGRRASTSRRTSTSRGGASRQGSTSRQGSGIDWNPWGKFRALGHRFVHQALGRDPGNPDAPGWCEQTLVGTNDFATVEVSGFAQE